MYRVAWDGSLILVLDAQPFPRSHSAGRERDKGPLRLRPTRAPPEALTYNWYTRWHASDLLPR